MLVSLLLAAALPATASPLAGLQYLIGTWNCTYRAGAVRFAYQATYAYDRDAHTLREVASWPGGGDEELLAYDVQHHGWTAVVLDQEAATILRVSGTEYALHATVRSGGKTIHSVDTCLRSAG